MFEKFQCFAKKIQIIEQATKFPVNNFHWIL